MTHHHSHFEHPVNVRHHGNGRSFGEKISDAITGFCASWPFFWCHIIWWAVWLTVVEHAPWGRLTMVLSLEAIILGFFILLSQNRSAAKDRDHAEMDYQTNLSAKHTAESIKVMTADIERLTSEIHAKVIQTDKPKVAKRTPKRVMATTRPTESEPLVTPRKKIPDDKGTNT